MDGSFPGAASKRRKRSNSNFEPEVITHESYMLGDKQELTHEVADGNVTEESDSDDEYLHSSMGNSHLLSSDAPSQGSMATSLRLNSGCSGNVQSQALPTVHAERSTQRPSGALDQVSNREGIASHQPHAQQNQRSKQQLSGDMKAVAHGSLEQEAEHLMNPMHCIDTLDMGWGDHVEAPLIHRYCALFIETCL